MVLHVAGFQHAEIRVAKPGISNAQGCDLKPPHETVSNIGPAAKAIQLDVTQEDDWRAALLESWELGLVDIAVDNKGYFPNRSIDGRPGAKRL